MYEGWCKIFMRLGKVVHWKCGMLKNGFQVNENDEKGNKDCHFEA